MWILLTIFNVAFAYLADKNYDNNKTLCKLSLCLIVIANAIILGLRDIGVGIDTGVYIESYFNYARNVSIQDYLSDDSYDKAYVLLALIANILSKEPVALLFVTESFIIIFLVIGLYELKKNVQISFFWFMVLFCAIYMRETVNLMRQFCAMALLFYAYAIFLQKRYSLFVIYAICAFFFHSTSIIFWIIPLAQLLSKSKSKFKYWYILGCILFFGGLLFFYFTLFSYLGEYVISDIYLDRYGEHSEYTTTGEVGFGYRYIIILIVELLVCYWLHKSKKIADDILYMLILLCCIDYLALQMRFIMVFFSRIAYYYGIIKIAYLASLFKYKGGFSPLIYIYLALIFSLSFYMYDAQTFRQYKLVYKSKILGVNESIGGK